MIHLFTCFILKAVFVILKQFYYSKYIVFQQHFVLIKICESVLLEQQIGFHGIISTFNCNREGKVHAHIFSDSNS